MKKSSKRGKKPGRQRKVRLVLKRQTIIRHRLERQKTPDFYLKEIEETTLRKPELKEINASLPYTEIPKLILKALFSLLVTLVFIVVVAFKAVNVLTRLIFIATILLLALIWTEVISIKDVMGML